MAGSPQQSLYRCPYCGGGMYTMDSPSRFKQQCTRCGWSPQDRPEHAEPKTVKKKPTK